MKKRLLTLLLALVSGTIAFGQTTPIKRGPSYIKVTQSQPATVENAKNLMREQLQLVSVDEMRLIRTDIDRVGMTHQRFQQYYQGIKVEFGTYTAHAKNNRLQSFSGNFLAIKDLGVTPVLSNSQALQAAMDHVGAQGYMWEEAGAKALDYSKPQGELVILGDFLSKDDQTPKLVYKFDIFAARPMSRADIYVDAVSGKVLLKNDKIHHADAVGTAATRYSASQSIHTDSYSGGFRLRDLSRGLGIETYNMNLGINYNAATDFSDNDNNWTSGEWNNAAKDNAALDAHWGAEQTYDYFNQTFARNSFDNNGAKIKSYVHFDLVEFGYPNNDNAFWNGSVMTYGDGTSLDPLTTLDIAAHEIGHAVCTFTANLVYQNESGAMNEGFSDIWAACVENFAAPNKSIWDLGEDLGIVIRSLSNPKSKGQPDTYRGTNWFFGTADNGGVHTNSGVLNHWFYILSVGKSGSNDNGDSYSVNGLGIAKAAEIAYRLESVYLSANSNYGDARNFGIQAAEDIYGADSPEAIATQNAFYAVGVGAAYSGPPTCVSGQVTLTIVLDNYPEETSWSVTDSGGATVASGGTYGSQPDGSTVTETLNLNAGDYNFIINDTYGDGICCSYGSGSYSLTDTGGGTIGSGGSFASSESVAFCIDGGGADTQAPSAPGNLSASNVTTSGASLSWNASSDNVGVTGYDVYVDGSLDGSTTGTSYSVTGLAASTAYELSVKAKDAAGNESASSTLNITTISGGGGTSTTISASFFESGLDGWTDGGGDCFRYGGTFSYEGSYSMRLRDNSGTRSAMTSAAFDVTSYNQIDVELYFYPNSMESGEDFWVRFYDGSAWSTVATYSSGSSFNNGTFYVATVTINSANYNFANNSRIRVQCDASSNQDQVYIDAVTITASPSSGILAGSGQSNYSLTAVSSPRQSLGNSGFEIGLEDTFLYPNPANDIINLIVGETINSVEIFQVSGRTIKEFDYSPIEKTVDVSRLASGLYLISIKTEEETIVSKFLKR